LAGTVKVFLFGIDPNDIRAFGVAALVLPLTALVASAIPAMRAASVDPTVALRTE
jgi:ABC-type lipoprotein release transport system permease subunit